MINICHSCGEYCVDKRIEPEGPYAICPECGYRHPFQQLPLLIVSGASGTGKSTVLHHLVGTVTEIVLLDGDILWRDEFNTPENNYRDYFETWLRMAKNISQSGRPVALFNAGAGVPENIEPCVERRYFSMVWYLALTCDAEVLDERLRARPQWRKSGDPDYIRVQIEFNQWFLENAATMEPPVELLDTTHRSIQMTSELAATWMRKKLTM